MSVAILARQPQNRSPRQHQPEHRQIPSRHTRPSAGRDEAGLRVRGYLSTAFGCPYEGDVSVDVVATLTERLLAMGVYEVAVSDTIGIAHPRSGVTSARRAQTAGAALTDRVALSRHARDGTGRTC